MLITTSRPLVGPSYLKLHIPSFSLFQYAPVEECIPLRAGFLSFGPSRLSVPLDLGSSRCWIIVLLTANLNGGCASAEGLDSEIKDCRILFCGSGDGQLDAHQRNNVNALSETPRTYDDCSVPGLRLCVLVTVCLFKSRLACLAVSI